MDPQSPTGAGYREIVVDVRVDRAVLKDPPEALDTVILGFAGHLQLPREVWWAPGISGELLLSDQAPIALYVLLQERPLRWSVVAELVAPTLAFPAVCLGALVGQARAHFGGRCRGGHQQAREKRKGDSQTPQRTTFLRHSPMNVPRTVHEKDEAVG